MDVHDRTRLTAAATVIGGALLPVGLWLYNVAPGLLGVAVVVPLLLGVGLLEWYAQSGDRVGVTITAIGLGSLLLTVLLAAFTPPTLVALLVIELVAVPGAVALTLGSALVGVGRYRRDGVGLVAVACLTVGVPIAVGAGPVLGRLVGGDLGAVVAGLAGVPYGAGWVAIGRSLRGR